MDLTSTNTGFFVLFLVYVADGAVQSNKVSGDFWPDLDLSQKVNRRCDIVRKECLLRETCANALNLVTVECSKIASESSAQCSVGCRNALASLINNDVGLQLWDCQCHHTECQTLRRKMDVCRDDVAAIMADTAPISCNLAELLCTADVSCLTALDYYTRLCREMFQGHFCTSKCRNSLEILLRQEKAAKLRGCRCQGQEMERCEEIKEKTQLLCYTSLGVGTAEDKIWPEEKISRLSGSLESRSEVGEERIEIVPLNVAMELQPRLPFKVFRQMHKKNGWNDFSGRIHQQHYR